MHCLKLFFLSIQKIAPALPCPPAMAQDSILPSLHNEPEQQNTQV